MEYRKDKLKPSQPYFVLDGKDFKQQIHLKNGISHFYTYSVKDGESYRVVPDGCIDILIEYSNDRKLISAHASGTPLKYSHITMSSNSIVFGVRFMPGIRPAIISSTMKQLVADRKELSDCLLGDDSWIDKIIKAGSFGEQTQIFLDNYLKTQKTEPRPFGKAEVVQSVKNLVYASDGQMRISEIAERTGYSERYINRIFIEEMGFSPKLFCKIIQFQRALELLNYGRPESMTEAATYLGYYDQSQFIRDFTKFAGITPKKYLDMVKKEEYKNKVKNID